MLHVPGAAAQSTSPFGVCRMRRTANGALNAPDPSALANPVWVVSQSPASPELLFLHCGEADGHVRRESGTGDGDALEVHQVGRRRHCQRRVDQRDGCVGGGRGRVRRGRCRARSRRSGAVVSGGGLGLGHPASSAAWSVDGRGVDGSRGRRWRLVGERRRRHPDDERDDQPSPSPARSPRRRMVSSVPVAPGTARTDTVRAKRHVCNLRRR